MGADEFLVQQTTETTTISTLGTSGPETCSWSAGTSLPALIERLADGEQTPFHPFSLDGCQG